MASTVLGIILIEHLILAVGHEAMMGIMLTNYIEERQERPNRNPSGFGQVVLDWSALKLCVRLRPYQQRQRNNCQH